MLSRKYLPSCKWSITSPLTDYYNCFRELLDSLSVADKPISMKSAIPHFIFTLGPEFEIIQNNFCIGNHPFRMECTGLPGLLSWYCADITLTQSILKAL